jgi:hypothetical protein
MRDRGTVLQLSHAWLITGTYGLRSSEILQFLMLLIRLCIREVRPGRSHMQPFPLLREAASRLEG